MADKVIDSHQVRSLVNESRTISELERKLQSKGFMFEDAHQLSEFVCGHLLKSYPAQNIELQNLAPEPIDEIPYHLVEINGVRYYLHGMVHGLSGSFTKSFKASEGLCRLVKESAERYVSKTSDYLFEENFDIIFYLDKTKSIEDIHSITIASPRSMIKYILNVYGKYLKLNISSIFRPHSMERNALLNDFSEICKKALDDPGYTQHLHDFYFKWMECSQPLDLQLSLAKDEFNQLTALRSSYMAKKAKAEVDSRGLQEMHILMGLGHLSQVEYFLKQAIEIKVERL